MTFSITTPGLLTAFTPLVQGPSILDFYYLGLIATLAVVSYLMSRLKGNLRDFGRIELLLLSLLSIPGYFFFLLLKILGFVTALIGSACLMLHFPFLIISISMFFEKGNGKKFLSIHNKVRSLIMPCVLLLFVSMVSISYFLFCLSLIEMKYNM